MLNRVINYMREFGSITTYDAFVDLGCTRLSEYIRQARLMLNVKDIGLRNNYERRTKKDIQGVC